MKQKFAVSLMGMDLMNVSGQIQALNENASMYHVDIIDWHYAKNMCLSPQFIAQLRPLTQRPIDVHLMVDGTELEIAQACMKAGADRISFQSDAIEKNVFSYIDQVKSCGKKFGVVLNPATPLEVIRPYAQELDLLTFMGVTPGFAGQKLVYSVLDKIKASIALREEMQWHYETQIDGGCHPNTMKAVHETGVDYIVLGNTFLFSQSSDMRKAWNRMETLFRQCVAQA